MLNKQQTQIILEEHFLQCLRFWVREGKDNKEALGLAIIDVRQTVNDPNEPYEIVPLNVEGKREFIKILIQLGGLIK